MQKVEVFQETSSDSLSLRVYEIGKKIGPTVYIQSSLHGAELQGTAVIHELILRLKSIEVSGTIRLAPAANPRSINQLSGPFTQGRFSPVTGDNWNRIFWDLANPAQKNNGGLDLKSFVSNHLNSDFLCIQKAYKNLIKEILKNKLCSEYGVSESKALAYTLQGLAADADYVLDLHTGSKAVRYLYVPIHCRESAKAFFMPCNLLVPLEFGNAFDEASFMPWVHLTNTFKEAGRNIPLQFESYTVELGSEETISLHDAKVDAERILNWLGSKGIIKYETPYSFPTPMACHLKDYKSYFAPSGGLMDFCVEPGDTINKGQILGNLLKLDKIGTDSAIVPIQSNAYGILVSRASSSNCHSGSEVFLVMENPEPL